MRATQKVLLPFLSICLLGLLETTFANQHSAESVRLTVLRAGASIADAGLFLTNAPKGPPTGSSGPDEAREARIVKACSASDEAPEALGGIIFSLIAEPLIDFVSKSISRKLEREGERYTGGFSASVSVPLYRTVKPRLSLGWSCVRFTRVSQGRLAVDFVAQLRLVPNGDAMQIRPLRLYYADMSIEKAENNSVGLAGSIAMTAVYLVGPESKETQAFEHTVFTSKRTIPFVDERDLRRQLRDIAKRQGVDSVSSDSVLLFDYMGFTDGTQLVPWSNYPALPLPRWSTDKSKESVTAGMANITFSMAEAGAKRDILKFAEWYWSETKDKYSKLLKDAAKKALDVEDS